MILADTSIWIEFLRRRSPVFEHMLFLLEHGEITTVEAIFGELLQGAKGARERRILLAYWDSLDPIPMEGLWIKAGLESGEKKWPSKGLGLIDASILSAVEEVGCTLWTLDKKLLSEADKSSDPSL